MTRRRIETIAFLGFCLVISVTLVVAYRPLVTYLRPDMASYLEFESSNENQLTIQAGETAKTSFRVRNRWGKPITVYGVTTSCGCFGATNVPLTIPAGDVRNLEFYVQTTPRQAGSKFKQDAVIYTDAPSPSYGVRILATVPPPATTPDAER